MIAVGCSLFSGGLARGEVSAPWRGSDLLIEERSVCLSFDAAKVRKYPQTAKFYHRFFIEICGLNLCALMRIRFRNQNLNLT